MTLEHGFRALSRQRKERKELETIREKQEKAFQRLQQKNNVTTIVIDSGPPVPQRALVVPAPVPLPVSKAPICNGSILTNPPQETSTAEATPTLLGKRKTAPALKRPAKRRKQPTSEDAEAMPLIPRRPSQRKKKPPVKVTLEIRSINQY
ncbi:hypothetical protein COOONC_16072 [Cooperia oncophora]